MQLPRLLAHLAELCHRRAVLVCLIGALLAGFSALYASGHLGVSTDTDDLFAASLPWRQRAIAYNRDFPQFNNLLVAVVDAREPEETDATAAALAQALAADKAHFLTVRQPDVSPFLRKEGLLFLDTKQLSGLLDHTIDAQPFLGQLVADPTSRGLFSALALLGMGVTKAGVDLAPYATALRAFHQAMADALDGHPKPLSWQRLLGGNLSDLAGQYRFVLVQPRQDFGALQPGGAATQAMRTVIANLPFVKSGDARVRITGQIALADEEFATVAQGAVEGLIGSVLLITVWLFLAVRSWRLIVPILLTLGLGLLLTLLFASVAVGTLNLVSVGFGILFVGIAVDFAIQFSVRYRERRFQFPDTGEALRQTSGRAGVQILVASLATAAGFLAFVPTKFAGVAELGLIAGVGMLIAFACTVTFLPAAISLCRPRAEAAEVGFAWAARLDPVVARRRGPILGVFAALALLALAVSPRLSFDSDPLHTKNPNTEAMRTLRDLMDSPLTNPYSIDILSPNIADAATLATKLEKLSTVSQVISLQSFVPEDQQAKLALIADADDILAPTLQAPSKVAPVTPEQIRLAAKTALSQIDPAVAKLPAGHPLFAIRDDLRRMEAAPDATLLATEAALTRFLPQELEQLHDVLSAQPVTAKDVPPDMARDWVLPDGQARVQVMPKVTGESSRELRVFVDQVLKVAPDAGGSAVTIEATSDTITGAFRSAAILAVIAITCILFAVLRRVRDVLLVLAPLTLSSLLTLLVAVLLPLPLNFANIIALPLLLGVGVSFNIYFVMNWRSGQAAILGSATARAILFSALTTGTAFGSLALSMHPGTASMGKLLLISLGCTLTASLVFIPALLAAVKRPTW
ncbi:MAG TPA: MMPL family transporter [Acetobacteraceae bacterium]|jgi:hopanoid biosynthesis associated RND transporter like protein HpnN|nr:MMPL family transporter [Acetobacteraceae bacterium]